MYLERFALLKAVCLEVLLYIVLLLIFINCTLDLCLIYLLNITLHCVCFVRGRRSAAMVVGTSCTTTKCKKKVSLSYPYPTVFVLKWFLILSNSYLTETGSLAGCFADYQVVTKIASKAIGRLIFRRKKMKFKFIVNVCK